MDWINRVSCLIGSARWEEHILKCWEILNDSEGEEPAAKQGSVGGNQVSPPTATPSRIKNRPSTHNREQVETPTPPSPRLAKTILPVSRVTTRVLAKVVLLGGAGRLKLEASLGLNRMKIWKFAAVWLCSNVHSHFLPGGTVLDWESAEELAGLPECMFLPSSDYTVTRVPEGPYLTSGLQCLATAQPGLLTLHCPPHPSPSSPNPNEQFNHCTSTAQSFKTTSPFCCINLMDAG